ncbi:MAG: sugar phosphate nucleotidyltransferase [Patescibacteria group bacterium]|nr:NTP transferase domain-containing protein [Patescibacteria group bacterium]
MTRQRITITIKNELLKMLDNFIDGSRIRNRSHAIEYIISKQLVPKDIKAFILAGGPGINFRPLTNDTPKAMIPVHDKPLLEYTLESLHKNNIKNIVLAVGFLGNKIKKYFKNGSSQGVRIIYSRDKIKNPGTVAPFITARRYLKDNPFLVIHGDLLTKINFLELINFHKSHKGLVTMALTPVNNPSNWGVAHMQGNIINEFQEKPRKPRGKSHLVNSGIYVFSPEVFKFLNKKQKSIEKELFPKLAKMGKLYGYPFEEEWHDVSTPEIYAHVIRHWQG